MAVSITAGNLMDVSLAFHWSSHTWPTPTRQRAVKNHNHFNCVTGQTNTWSVYCRVILTWS